MGKATLARQKAIGTIGGPRVTNLEEKGLLVVDKAEYEQLVARRKDLEQEVARLRRALDEGPQTVAAQVLREAMGR
jgi:hypothetical protein